MLEANVEMGEITSKKDIHALVYCQEDGSIINCDIVPYLKDVSTAPTHKIDMLHFPERYWLDIYEVYNKEGLSEQDHSEMREKFMAVILHYSEPSISYSSFTRKGLGEQMSGKYISEETRLEEVFVESVRQWRSISRGMESQSGAERKCTCSHHITRYYPIVNTVNGNTLITGCVCINKVKPNEDLPVHGDIALLSKVMRKCGKCKKEVPFTEIKGCQCSKCSKCWKDGPPATRVCPSCLRLLVPPKQHRCNSCIKKMVNRYYTMTISPRNMVDTLKSMVKCLDCQRYIYPGKTSGGAAKIRCKQCWKLARSIAVALPPLKGAKECLKCNTSLPVGAPDWKTECRKCFMDRPSCNQCRKRFQPKFKGAPLCYSCWRSNRDGRM